MSIGTTGAIIAAAGLGLGGSLASSAIGANAATTAAGQQVSADEQAIQLQRDIFAQQQANFAPFLQAGQTSVTALMSALGLAPGGPTGPPQFGPGSLPPVPQFTGQFHVPTLQEAQAQPGYEFALQQGLKGITQAGAAAGGAISGGTLKAADQFANNLAETNYQNVFNQNLAQWNTGLDAYKAQLAGYGTTLAGQAQQFGELLAPIQIGAGAAGTVGQFGSNAAAGIGSLLQGIGNSQAAGTVGSANALTSGISGGTNAALQAILLKGLLGTGGGGGGIGLAGLTPSGSLDLSIPGYAP